MMVDYVYGRKSGEIYQEIGGVMLSLACLCNFRNLDMIANGEAELNRVWDKIEEVRQKASEKPKLWVKR